MTPFTARFRSHPQLSRPLESYGELARVWSQLRITLDILVAILLVVVVVSTSTPAGIVAAIVFSCVYGAGVVGPIARARAWIAITVPRGLSEGQVSFRRRQWGLVVAWLIAVSIAWIALATATRNAVFLVFPVYFVILQVVGGISAVVAVAAATIVAIGGIALHEPLTFGHILGPVLGGVSALIVGLGFRLIQREALEKTEALRKLSEARAESEALSRRAGELDERARLASEIHDTVAQGLASIQLLLHSVESRMVAAHHDDASIESLRLARSVAAENLAETRRIIAALQPAPLADANLPGALRKVCAGVVISDIVHFEVDGTPESFPPDVEAVVVRAVQSTLSNVVKHAQATTCRVTLTYQPDALIVDVVDDGVGYDPTATTPLDGSGVGIRTTRQRVEKLGGTYVVESAPGQGCGVSIHIPRPVASSESPSNESE